MTVTFDGARFTVGGLEATLDEVARVYFHHVHVKYRGTAAIAQPFLGGEQGTIRVVLADGREASERVRGEGATEVARRLAHEAGLRAGARDLEKLRGWEMVDYGPVGLSKTGIRLKKKVIPWAEISGYRFFQGALMVDRQGKLARTIWLSRIANLSAFRRALAEVAPDRDYERLPADQRPKGSLLFPSAATRDPRYPTFRARMAALSLFVIWIPPYLLLIVPFALYHQTTLEADRVHRARVLEPALASLPPEDAPLATPFGEGCPAEPIAPEALLALGRDRYDSLATAVVSGPHAVAVPTRRPRGPVTFGQAYSKLLYEVPTDWPLGGRGDPWEAVRWTLVASEVSAERRVAGSRETVANLRLLRDGEPVCEGAAVLETAPDAYAFGPGALALGGLAAVLTRQCPALGAVCDDLAGQVSARPR